MNLKFLSATSLFRGTTEAEAEAMLQYLGAYENLLQISAQKNLALSRRSVHTAPKTIRGRLLSYLSEWAKQNGVFHFAIPFNRQQFADYMGVDRSVLSNELSKTQGDGILKG